MISIIVPVYKVRDYLPGCLDSILANDLTDCEVVLVDDGSPDDCGEICDRYCAAHPVFFRVIHQENRGLGGARNTGIETAKGDWLLFVDSDDKLVPQALTTLKNAIDGADAEVVGFQFRADNGKDPPKPQNCGFEGTGSFHLTERKDYLLSLPSAWLRLWKKSLFLENDIRYPSKVWYEDIRTTAKLLPLAKKILVLPDALYDYLSRPGSIMASANLDRNREILDAFDDILGWYREKGLFEEYESELCALTAEHVILAASVRVARADPAHPLLKEFYDYTDAAFPRWRENPYLSQLPRGKALALRLVNSKSYRLLRLLFRLKG